jgi:RHS repeat-associated protein
MIYQILCLLLLPLCAQSAEDEPSAIKTVLLTTPFSDEEVNATLSDDLEDASDEAFNEDWESTGAVNKATQADDAANSQNPSIVQLLESEPSAFVGRVNVITGAYHEFAQDIILPGPEPLAIQRVFSFGSRTDDAFDTGWMINHAGWFSVESKKPFEVIVSGPFGSCHTFTTKKAPKKGLAPMKLSIPSSSRNLSNTTSGHISGRTNIKNQVFQSDRYGDEGVLQTGSGSSIYYQKTPKVKWYTVFNINALIREETKPNGNKILYKYDSNNRIKTITTTSATGQVYAEVELGNASDSYFDYHLCASDGRKVRYQFLMYKVDSLAYGFCLRKVSPANQADYEKYEYVCIKKGLYALSKKILPSNRYLETLYHKAGKLYDKGKVFCQRAPLGTNNNPVIMYKFIYNNKGKKTKVENFTDVFDALRHKTRYNFLHNAWLTSITPYSLDGNVYRIEQFHWGPSSDPRDFHPIHSFVRPALPIVGNLISRTIQRPDKTILGGKAYLYDNRSNVLVETLFGNLTGTNPIDATLDEIGYPLENGCHQYKISYRYTDDGKNLVLEESYPNGKKVLYTYYPNTDLIKSRLTYEGNTLALREFFTYDANTVLIQSIRDNGVNTDSNDLTGVTERLITRTQPKASLPCVGLPEVVSEYCLDSATGKELLIKKLVNEYNRSGHLVKQHHYGNDDVLAYTLLWDYDDKGRLFWEMNAIGEISYRHFDRNGNRILEQGPDDRYHTKYEYDYMNRLISEKIVDRNGKCFGTSYRYDLLGNRTAVVDGYGNETLYDYDEFSRLKEERKSLVALSDGLMDNPKTLYTYDLLGYCTSITDPRGLKTEKESNLRGQPLFIHYPDGSSEYFTYTLDGKVERTIEKTGNQTTYEYDFLGRLIKKTIYSPTSDLLSETTATYNTFHLMSEVDAAGVETRYTYDPAGRMASKICGNAHTTYHYDPLGRLSETRDWLDEDKYQANIHILDFLNRVVEERLEDEQGVVYSLVRFSYDCHGKRSSVKQENAAGIAIETISHDLYGRQTLVTDADGNKTVTEYNDTYQNVFGQYVLQTKRTDPLGNQTITTYDALNRVCSIICKNPFGHKTRDQEVFYDLGNNKVLHIETVVTPDKPERKVVSFCEYDKGNRLVHFVEGLGSPKEKHSRSTYDKAGRKEKTIKFDGVEICQQYDLLGLLSDHSSSDASIHYLYHYNARGLPVEIEDTINQTKTLRAYDDNGRLTEEMLGNGLAFGYTYDALGRPLTITLPDASKISYTYQGPYLRTVGRLSSAGEQQYLHTYAERDLSGNITREELINGVRVDHKCDILGRPVESRAGVWEETEIDYDPMGNLIKRKITDGRGVTPYVYTYDDLYQLSSESGLEDHQYAYDSLYNRVKKDETLYDINSLNQIVKDSVRQYTYDRNGNLIGKQGQGCDVSYTYDALDRLVKVTNDQSAIAFTYDAFNRRLTKDIGDNETRYLYLGQNEVGAHIGGAMAELRVLGTGKGAEIGAAVAIEICGGVFAPLHDHNGNVAALLNPKGELIESYHYTGFGEGSYFDGVGNVLDKAISPWRFSSKRVHAETGLIDFGRRNYDPESGRWITPDPIGPEGGPNPYAYVCNNPLTHFDQYGLFTLGGFLGGIIQCLGWIIGTVSYEGIPLVIVKDAFMAVGHLLSGNGPGSFVASYRQQHSTIGSVGDSDDITQRKNLGVNGVHTEIDDAEKRAQEISLALRGQKVDYVYNATHGFTSDILEWLGQRLGFPTNSATKLVDSIRKEWSMNPGREIRLWLHSQGGEIGACLKKMLTPEELALIEVNTFGSANLFDKGHFAEVTHYVSSRDWVPLLSNPIQYLKAVLGGRSDVTFLKSITPGSFNDHSYDGLTYQTKIKELLQNINKGLL